MNYREMYAALSQHELRNVAARARLTVEDIQQEALLCCWQMASGRCDYDSQRGSVRQYVMAKLWGLASRASELPTVRWGGMDDDGESGRSRCRVDAEHASPSVLDTIIGGEERQVVDRRMQAAQRAARFRYAGVSSTAVLMDQGISSGQIASLTGVTPQAVRQRVARERARAGVARSCQVGREHGATGGAQANDFQPTPPAPA